MTLTRLTALDGEAILPLVDAKLHLRVKHTEEDSLIEALRDAAVNHVERVSGVALAQAQFRWSMRALSTHTELPVRPAVSVEAVTYLDIDGGPVIYSSARLVNDAVYPAANESWPTSYGYAAVDFTAGLASPDEAPDLIAAAKLLLGHFFSNREAVNVGNNLSQIPLGVDALIGTHRRILV